MKRRVSMVGPLVGCSLWVWVLSACGDSSSAVHVGADTQEVGARDGASQRMEISNDPAPRGDTASPAPDPGIIETASSPQDSGPDAPDMLPDLRLTDDEEVLRGRGMAETTSHDSQVLQDASNRLEPEVVGPEESDLCDSLQCNDGNVCNGMEACHADAGCLPGTPMVCDDGDGCTLDDCHPVSGCLSTPLCDDGDPCTVDQCDGQNYICSVTLKDCDDGLFCTIDSCESESGACVHEFLAVGHPGCDDENPCSEDFCIEQCGEDSTSPCEQLCSHPAMLCDDGNPCTEDSCEPETGICLFPDVICADGDLCNGQESCDSESGACLAGEPVLCDDAEPCNGQEICEPNSGTCVEGEPLNCDAEIWDGCAGKLVCETGVGCVAQDAPACPTAPSACDQTTAEDGAVVGVLTVSSPEAFVIKDEGVWEYETSLADAIAQHPSVQTVSMATIVLNDLDRDGQSLEISSVDCEQGAFKWNEEDNAAAAWWPQGVTGSAAGALEGSEPEEGTVAGRQLLLVSWYHKAEEDSASDVYQGVRIAIVDISEADVFKYRLALLAEPIEDQGVASYAPLSTATSSVHAGGISWFANYLYVADTSHGFRVFDLSRIQKVQVGDGDLLGYDAVTDAYYAYGYEYVIPQVGRYTLCDESCCARFSWASVDSSSEPPSILAGEYDSGGVQGRAHRWPLDPATGRLASVHGVVRSSEVYFPGVTRMQGGVCVDGHYFFSSSQPKLSLPMAPGTLFDATAGDEIDEHQYPLLPEDLYYQKGADSIWSCTESPASWGVDTRFCFRVGRHDVIDNDCD